MNKRGSFRKANQFIKKERLKRKLKMYKLAFQVLVDRTTAIYLLILVGYLFASFFIVGDFIRDYEPYFTVVEQQAIVRLPLLFTLLPLRYIIQSFSRPGIIYSSSEYQLSMLTYSRTDIWFASVLSRWMKSLAVLSGIGVLLVLITPLPIGLISTYVVIFVVIEILMTVPQWKLFQLNIGVKISCLLLALVLNISQLLFTSIGISLAVFCLLIILHYFLSSSIFKQVKWSQVTEIGDFEVWNMPIISKASEVKIERKKKYHLFHNSTKRRKAFTYTKRSIYRQMWNHYFGKNILLMLQLVGTLILLLTVFRFTNYFLFAIGIAISLHVYTTGLASLFRNQFETDLITILPWDVKAYKQSFFYWMIYGAIILFLPIVSYLIFNFTWWVPVQLLFYISTLYLMYHVKIDKAIATISKEVYSNPVMEGLSYLLLIGLVYSLKYPVIALIFIVNYFILKSYKSKSKV